MIIMLIAIVLTLSLPYVWYKDSKAGYNDFWNGSFSIFTFCSIVMWIIIGITFWASYDTAGNLIAFDKAVKHQYKDAITVYKECVSIKISAKMDDKIVTDLKNQGYQQSIAELITETRDKVAWYNDKLSKKRYYASNPFFSWMIIVPDLKLISLKEQM